MRALPVHDAFAGDGVLRPDGLMVHDLFLLRAKPPADSRGEWDLLQVLDTIPGETVFPSPEEERHCPLAR